MYFYVNSAEESEGRSYKILSIEGIEDDNDAIC